MKITYILTSIGVGGLEKRFSSLYKYFHEQSSDDIIYFVISRSQYVNFFDIYSSTNKKIVVKRYGLSIKKQSKLFFISKILKYTHLVIFFVEVLLSKRIKNDITHFVDDNSTFLYPLLKGRSNIKSFYNGLRPEKQISQQKKKISLLLGRNFQFDCLSESIKKAIVDTFPNFSNQVYSSPCSFSDYSFTKNVWSQKENAIAFVSRLDYGKGVELLIETIKLLNKETNPKIKIYICGNGVLMPLLKSELGKMKDSNVAILGYISDPKSILRKTKIFLSLQDNENYPSQSLLEAMACTNAIIATNVGETDSIVKPNTGRLVPKNNAASLSHEIIKLYSAPELEMIGQAAREFAITEHTIQKFVQYLNNLYRCKS